MSRCGLYKEVLCLNVAHTTYTQLFAVLEVAVVVGVKIGRRYRLVEVLNQQLFEVKRGRGSMTNCSCLAPTNAQGW